MRKLIQDEGGQVIIDYLLTLAAVVTFVSILAVGFRRTLYGLWSLLAREISAACPGCPPDPSIRLGR